jgi:EpsI family protein
VFVGPDAERLVRYVNGDQWVDVYVAYYAYQRRDAEAVNYLNTLHRVPEQPEDAVTQLDGIPDPWSRVTDYSFEMAIGGERPVTGVHLKALNNDRRLVLPLYWVGSEITQSRIQAKLLQLEAVLTGRSEAAAGIVLAAPFAEDPQDAARILQSFAPALADIRAALADAAPR